jgi:hypothetical protein
MHKIIECEIFHCIILYRKASICTNVYIFESIWDESFFTVVQTQNWYMIVLHTFLCQK